MRSRRDVVVVTLFALTLVSSSALLLSQASKPESGRIEGQVTDEGGNPVTDLRIAVTSGAPHYMEILLAIDEEGKYELSELSPGVFQVGVRDLRGNVVEIRSVNVQSGLTTKANFVLASNYVSWAVDLARDYLEGTSTYRFDGIVDTVELQRAGSTGPYTWEIVLNYESRAAGYGDRTGMITPQVTTLHTMRIVVEHAPMQSPKILVALVDDAWDERQDGLERDIPTAQ